MANFFSPITPITQISQILSDELMRAYQAYKKIEPEEKKEEQEVPFDFAELIKLDFDGLMALRFRLLEPQELKYLYDLGLVKKDGDGYKFKELQQAKKDFKPLKKKELSDPGTVTMLSDLGTVTIKTPNYSGIPSSLVGCYLCTARPYIENRLAHNDKFIYCPNHRHNYINTNSNDYNDIYHHWQSIQEMRKRVREFEIITYQEERVIYDKG